jgi:hypothetical protein
LPDYLNEPVRNLGDISSQLTALELDVYKRDTAELKEAMTVGAHVVTTPCPPDYFPGTWRESELADARWQELLIGIGSREELV